MDNNLSRIEKMVESLLYRSYVYITAFKTYGEDCADRFFRPDPEAAFQAVCPDATDVEMGMAQLIAENEMLHMQAGL